VPKRERTPVGQQLPAAATMNREIERLERLLRAARPAPSPLFVHELERRLCGRLTHQPHRRLHPLIAGWGIAAGLAAVCALLAVAGLLPLTSSGSHARAASRCSIVTVERTELRPRFEVDKRGKLHVRYERDRVPRLIKACR
jgi:hypothetical protein